MLQAANRAGLEHLQRWAMTRTGYHGKRVDGEEPGRYEAAGLMVTSWLQGTSRDGDMQDHVHNQIARMSLTARDGVWRAIDTMALRAQLGAVRRRRRAPGGRARAPVRRASGTRARTATAIEIKGISREQIEAYSTRTQTIDKATRRRSRPGSAEARPGPDRRELLYIRKEVTMATREGKEEGAIDWESSGRPAGGQVGVPSDGTQARASVARQGRNLRGPGSGAPRARAGAGVPRRRADAQHARDEPRAGARPGAQATWIRADLMREIADALPPEAHAMAPADARRAGRAAD